MHRESLCAPTGKPSMRANARMVPAGAPPPPPLLGAEDMGEEARAGQGAVGGKGMEATAEAEAAVSWTPALTAVSRPPRLCPTADFRDPFISGSSPPCPSQRSR